MPGADKKCVEHHHACDCREAKFKGMKQTIETFLYDLDEVEKMRPGQVVMSSAMWMQVQAFRRIVSEF